ncbi:MAG: biotin-dependent carboxyltransferase [Dermatophilaceae bacterium]|nr:biotin-dependent carboxyltransferase [Dermatophilaceae bacterium]MBU9943013.1 biotin-dependent carboxyltransferase family protein [Dermatophilaceae bacterium]
MSADSARLEVISPGLLSTVQDAGRAGYYHLGIPPSGAMDQLSYRAANLLVGNDETAAAIEFALMGPTLRFTADVTVAVTGANVAATLDGAPIAGNARVEVGAGQQLALGFAQNGARGYVAVSGGLDVPLVLGSRSTYALGGLGGFRGRALVAGDELPLGPSPVRPRGATVLPENLRVPLRKEYELRLMLGLYADRVEPDSLDRFLAETWSVGSEADRIGYRLKNGTPLRYVQRVPPFGAGDDPSNIVDACYPIGSVQVPSGTEPIILHRDAVSGGGYMMVGTVISADLDVIGQMPPGTKVRFVAVDLDQALAARHERAALLEAVRDLLAGSGSQPTDPRFTSTVKDHR